MVWFEKDCGGLTEVYKFDWGGGGGGNKEGRIKKIRVMV